MTTTRTSPTPPNPQLAKKGVLISGKRRLAIRDSFVKITGPKLISARQHHAFRAYLLALWCCYPFGLPRLPGHLENKHLAAVLDLGQSASSRRSSAGHVLRKLEDLGLIRRFRDGKSRTVIVCHESGNGDDYTQPKGGGPNAYIVLPSEFFTNGWLTRLSAPAILVLLIALREERFMKHRREQEKWNNTVFDWFQPVSRLSEQYNIGSTTIEKGLKELKVVGFLTTELTGRHPRDGFPVNPRNLYTNHFSVFRSAAKKVKEPDKG